MGQTSYSNPFGRFMEHQKASKKGSMFLLHVAMREHGVRSFECECIWQAPNASLNDLECYYAEQYGAYVWDGGYNQVECGKAVVCREVSDETRMWMKRRAMWKIV